MFVPFIQYCTKKKKKKKKGRKDVYELLMAGQTWLLVLNIIISYFWRQVFKFCLKSEMKISLVI